MRELALRVDVPGDDLLDTAGTGGGTPTFNVSTTAAFIAAGAGCRVAKHGNRSATGLCGSADLLEALGARIDLPPAAVAQCIDEVGFGFMFAPQHHQATRFVVPVRKALGVQTIFNFLGPLTNPAGATRQLIGVSDPRYMDLMAGALVRLGCRARARRLGRGRHGRGQHRRRDEGGRGHARGDSLLHGRARAGRPRHAPIRSRSSAARRSARPRSSGSCSMARAGRVARLP